MKLVDIARQGRTNALARIGGTGTSRQRGGAEPQIIAFTSVRAHR